MHNVTSQKGQALIIAIIALLTVGSIMMVGGFKMVKTPPVPLAQSNLTPVPPAFTDNQNNIQMNTFGFTTGAPIPTTPVSTPTSSNAPACGLAIPNGPLVIHGTTGSGQCCVEDGPVNSPADCCPGVSGGVTVPDANLPWPAWCDAKPVIYLYPKVSTNVSVKVTVPGKITVSIPEYNNGWDVTANPDGTLISNGKIYSELFYETVQRKSPPPDNGLVVRTDELKPTLTKITTVLGLKQSEQSEFLGYWLPRLTSLNRKYILVSYFSPQQKEEVDHVEINPKPDTFINFIMYFKGIDKKFDIKPMKLPVSPPVRTGFTAVEWGGILDNN